MISNLRFGTPVKVLPPAATQAEKDDSILSEHIFSSSQNKLNVEVFGTIASVICGICAKSAIYLKTINGNGLHKRLQMSRNRKLRAYGT